MYSSQALLGPGEGEWMVPFSDPPLLAFSTSTPVGAHFQGPFVVSSWGASCAAVVGLWQGGECLYNLQWQFSVISPFLFGFGH